MERGLIFLALVAMAAAQSASGLVAAAPQWRLELVIMAALYFVQGRGWREGVFIVALGLPVPHVLETPRRHRHVGVGETTLARARHRGLDEQRQRQVVAHAGRRERRVDDVAGHMVLKAAEHEGGDLDRQRPPDLAGAVEPE